MRDGQQTRDSGASSRGTRPEVHGWCDPRLGKVRDVFTEHFTRGDEVGASVCVYVGDQLAVDLWGGAADARTARPWQRDTPCLTFSCTKALTAVCALRLWEQGAFDLEAPVTTWWPEFGRAGKGKVTAAHLLSHQAGLPAFDSPVTVAQSADHAAMAARLAAQPPEWEPGTAHGYHAVTFGWLAGEIVRRLVGQTAGEYLADRIAGPHGLDIWLGAPDGVIDRAARLTRRRPSRIPAAAPQRPPRTAPPDIGAAAAPPRAAGPADRIGPLLRAAYNPDVTTLPGGSNNPMVLRAGWPASGALASAAGLAGFYRHLIAGRIVGPATLRAALATRAIGRDRVLSMNSAFGLGFMLPTPTFPAPQAGCLTAFGHAGFGGSLGLGDVTHEIALAYVPNRLGDELAGERRAARIVEAVYGCVA